MDYIFLIAAFNGLYFVFLLLQKRPKAVHDNILIFWLIYLSLFTAAYAFTADRLFAGNQLYPIVLISMFLLHGPFLYLYASALTLKDFKLKGRGLLHFAPFVLFALYLLLAATNPAYAQRIRIDHVPHHVKAPIPYIIFLAITALSGPVYFILTLKLFRRLDINIFNNLSYYEDVDLKWLRKLVTVFGVVWSVLILIAVIHHLFLLFTIDFCINGLFLSLSAFIILIGFFGLRQKIIFTPNDNPKQPETHKSEKKYSGSRLTDLEAVTYANSLNQLMKSSKPYLNPELTLFQLAAEMNISTHYLSQVINERFQLNFFDFINQYRVSEVKERIADPKNDNFTLLGIALESGFNSKSAFNRIFKKLTGQTPSQFKSSVSV